MPTSIEGHEVGGNAKPIIGFVGLGQMGGCMVENLRRGGFEMVVYAVLARGRAQKVATPRDLAVLSGIVMLFVTTSDAVDSQANGVTRCIGSLGARGGIDVVKIARTFGVRIHFVYLRNVVTHCDGSY